MKKNLLFLSSLFAISLFVISCQPAGTKTEKPAADTTAMEKDTTQNVFEHLLVDNRKDPACGMPVLAGIHDTAHYKKKVLGFCSKECKGAFQKNPDALIAAADLKK
jgi:YHS domain-containing protein